MGVIKFALRTLINDLKQAIFYFFTIALSIAVMLNVFNLLYNEKFGGVNENGYGNVSDTKYSSVVLVVLVVAILIIFYANQFFLLRKKREFAIAVLSGRSLVSVTMMSILHNIIIIGLGLVFGIIIGIALMPYILSIGYSLSGVVNGDVNALSKTGIIITIGTFFLEIFYVVLINVGMVYRLQVVDLMKEESAVAIKKGDKRGERFKWGYIVAMILPFVFFIFGALKLIPSDVSFVIMPALLFPAIAGIEGFIIYLLPNFILKKKEEFKHKKSENFLILAEVNKLINKSRANMFIISFSSFVLIYCMVNYYVEDKRLFLMATLGYMATLVLFCIALIFKQVGEGVVNKRAYKKFYILGFTKNQLKNIIVKTNSYYFGILILIPLVYIGMCTTLFTIIGSLPLNVTLMINGFSLGVFLVTLGVTVGVNLKMFKKSVV